MKNRISIIRVLRSVLPPMVKRNLGSAFWWLWMDEDIFGNQGKRDLDTLRNGGSLEPGIGSEEEREYLQKYIYDYYGSFEGLSVLGAGCGTGRAETWLAGNGANVVCLDHASEAIQISRIHAQRIHCTEDFVVGDLENMPFKEKTFDLINSGGVVEHFENVGGILREYFRITKPNGVIIVSVPNLVGVNAVFGMKPFTEHVLKISGTCYIERDFSARGFRKAIEGAGFICIDISPTLFNTFDSFPFKYLRRGLSLVGLYGICCRLLDALGRKFPGIAFGYSFMVAFARRPEAY